MNPSNFMNPLMQRMFRAVDNVVWDMTTGRVGFSSNDGICSIELGNLNEDKTEAPDAQITINPLENFGMSVPAFAQSTPPSAINIGDMIYSNASNKVLGWVIKKSEKSFKLMKQDGTRSDWSPPKVQILGLDSGVMVLRSLMNMLPGGSSQLNQMSSMLMPMMMMGMTGDSEDGSGVDMNMLMPMLLMNQTATSDPAAASAGMGNIMNMMMMMSMMRGGGMKGMSPKSNQPRIGNSGAAAVGYYRNGN